MMQKRLFGYQQEACWVMLDRMRPARKSAKTNRS